MRVLVACETSGVVSRAFRALGHDVWSSDLLPAVDCPNAAHVTGDGDCCGHHIGDVTPLLQPGMWDLMIAHPPCTYLTNAAAWAYGDGPYHQKVKPGTLVGAARRAAREEAIAFVVALMNAPIPRIAIENPIGVLSTRLHTPDQIIQPWMFGDDASKATGLWLKDLPLLQHDSRDYVAPRMVNGKARWANQTDSGQNRLSPSADRWKQRSVTYAGIAAAMAAQWGRAVMDHREGIIFRKADLVMMTRIGTDVVPHCELPPGVAVRMLQQLPQEAIDRGLFRVRPHSGDLTHYQQAGAVVSSVAPCGSSSQRLANNLDDVNCSICLQLFDAEVTAAHARYLTAKGVL